MKIKTETIVNFIESGLAFKNYPTSMAYKMLLNKKACDSVYEAYNEQRKKLIDKYAEKDEDGNPVVVDNRFQIADPEAWNKDIAELLGEEVEVTISEIPAEMLDKCEPPHFDALSVPELELIDFMIK